MESPQTLILKTEDVRVHRRSRLILDGISFDVRQGEVLGLIGANGSGKSTLIKSLLSLLPLTAGSVVLLGRSLPEWEPRERARRVAYLAQENECRWPLVVRRVVALGRMPYQGPWKAMTSADHAVVDHAMETVGAGHLAERTVTRLSGGERHRVLLARALASEPELLLADEPTAGLDPFHQLHLMELFRAQAAQGKTILVVLHDLTLASRFCDRLLLLKDGKRLAFGSPEDVLSERVLREGYGITAASFQQNGTRATVPWACVEPSDP